MKHSYLKTLFAFSVLFWGILETKAQFIETFETETLHSNSFTSNGQTFTVSSSTGTYDIYEFTSGGWNGSSTDHKFVDNTDFNDGSGNGSNFTVTSNGGTDFLILDLYIYCSDLFLANHSGTLTLTGKKDGATIYTITKTSGFSNPATLSPNNGFTFINFATEGASDYSDDPVDELIFTSTGNLDYMALDAFRWNTIATDTQPPSVQTITLSGTPPTTSSQVDFIVTFNENASNVSMDDFTTDPTGSATGTISAISGSGTTYTVTVNSLAGEGTMSIDLNNGTNIIDDLGNGNGTNGNTSAFTAGETHTVSSCFEESFENFNVADNTFGSNGLPFSSTNGLDVFFLSNAGAGGSHQYLDNNGSGSGAYSIKTTGGELFTMKAIDLYLSSIVAGTTPTNDGTLTINGKISNATVYTITKTTGFPTSTGGDNGFFNLNFATDGAADYTTTNVDEIEIVLGSAFVYLAVDHFEFCEDGIVDTLAPEVQSIVVSGNPTTLAASIDFVVTFNENAVNVTADDFSVDTTGTTGNITGITGSNNVYTVTVDNISGEGTISIDLKAGTDIEDALGNSGSLAFTSGENHTVSACFVEDFESFADGVSTFTSNGIPLSSTNGLVVKNHVNAGIGDSDYFLENNGAGAGSYSIKTTDSSIFTASTMFLYLSSSATGAAPTADGTLTIRGKVAGATVYTFNKTTSFPTTVANGSNGFFQLDFATAGASDFSIVNVDEIEIEILSSFVYLAVDNFEICSDTTAPRVQSITRQTPSTSPTNADTLVFSVLFNEAVTNVNTADFSVSGTTATPTSVVDEGGNTYSVTVSGGNLASLNGTVSLSLSGSQNIVDSAGNALANTTPIDTPENFDIDNTAPTGYAIVINQNPINAGNDDAVSYTFTGAEAGTTYNYTFSTSGGAGTVTGSGTITSAGQTISGIDLSGIADGTITLSVTLTDTAGNTGSAATDTKTKETVAPTGYSVVINQNPINASNDDAVSYTFSSAEVGATYNYTFSTSGGAGTITGSGTVASAGATISAIDLSSLADGTITLNVTLTDVNGNTGSATTDTETKDTDAPSGYTVTINQSPINSSNDNAVSYTFTAAEIGATYNYTFSTSGGAGTISGSGTIASIGQTISGINLSSIDDGTITLSVTLTDVNGNIGSTATDTETKDTDAPTGYTVGINQNPINGSNDNTVSYTFTAAEVGATYNYTFSTSGGAGTVTGSGTIASTGQTVSGIDLSSIADGTITLNVTLTDANGNTGGVATDTETKDTAAPTGYSVTINQTPITATNDTAVSFTFTTAEVGATYNYTFSSDGGGTNITGSGTVNSSGETISGIDLSALGDGTITINTTLTDSSGNTGGTATNSTTKDAKNPTTTITSSENSPTGANPIPITITFDETVGGFSINDIIIENGTAGNLTGSGTTYTIDVTPTSSGIVTIDIPADVVLDFSGNGNSAASQFTITFDNVRPSVTIQNVPTLTNTIFTTTFEFSENVNGFTLEDITVNNGTASNFTTIDQNTYTAVITPTTEGEVTIDINENIATDAVGNTNTAAMQVASNFDETAPEVTISSTETSPTRNSSITIDIEFTESVIGFQEGDLTIVNGTISNFSGSGTNYTAVVTPIASGNISIDIAAAVANDEAGNENIAATQFSIIYNGNGTSNPSLNELEVYPNPNNGILKISGKTNSLIRNIEIFDMFNRRVFTQRVNGYSRVYSFDITSFPAGIYLVKINTANTSITKEFIRQ